MIDSELSRKIKIERELDAKAKRYRKILQKKYKTGNYSPSKCGLEPGTPLKMTPDKTFTITSPMSQPYIWGTLGSSCTSAMGLGDIQSNVTSPLPDPILFGECQSMPMKVTPITPSSTGPSQSMPVKMGPVTKTSTVASLSGQLVLSASQLVPVNMGPITPKLTLVSPSGQMVPSVLIWDDDDDAILLSAD